MELLAKLLGGNERVKIMRLFLHQGDVLISATDVAHKTKSKTVSVRREINALVSIGFLEKKKTRTVITGSAKKASAKVKEIVAYTLNNAFPHNKALEDLLFDFELLDKRELAGRFKSIGRIKLFIAAGIFIGDEKSRVDILIVGEGIKKNKADKVIELLSAEIGRDIVCSVMDVEEYEYRFKMYDKFVRDIIELPHETIIDKITQRLTS
jgi:DNA-binding transcriptional regulator YhcF (GntR family)